jgi:hypothetical protein
MWDNCWDILTVTATVFSGQLERIPDNLQCPEYLKQASGIDSVTNHSESVLSPSRTDSDARVRTSVPDTDE